MPQKRSGRGERDFPSRAATEAVDPQPVGMETSMLAGSLELRPAALLLALLSAGIGILQGTADTRLD